MDKIALRFQKKVEKAILAKEYKVIERDSNTVTIEALGETMDIWMGNLPEYTRVFRIMLDGLNTSYYGPDVVFNNPEKCREILSDMSAEEAKKIRAEIEYKQSMLEALESLKGVNK